MTYTQMNQLIRKRIETARGKYRRSEFTLDQYLNRVSDIIQSRAEYIKRNKNRVFYKGEAKLEGRAK